MKCVALGPYKLNIKGGDDKWPPNVLDRLEVYDYLT